MAESTTEITNELDSLKSQQVTIQSILTNSTIESLIFVCELCNATINHKQLHQHVTLHKIQILRRLLSVKQVEASRKKLNSHSDRETNSVAIPLARETRQWLLNSTATKATHQGTAEYGNGDEGQQISPPLIDLEKSLNSDSTSVISDETIETSSCPSSFELSRCSSSLSSNLNCSDDDSAKLFAGLENTSHIYKPSGKRNSNSIHTGKNERRRKHRTLVTCEVCSATFTKPSLLVRHQYVDHKLVASPGRWCPRCGAKFLNAQVLQTHRREGGC